MRRLKLVLLLAMLVPGRLPAGQGSGVAGYWREPEGSVIHVDTCGGYICAVLVSISASAPARIDGKNPDANLRRRSLCGLHIGEGFHLTAPDKAEGGTLYDPKSGRTYHGTMSAHGDTLDLRGYVGISIFGRTERWTRTGDTATCTALADQR